MVQRRLDHEPIQYILGEWDFYNMTNLTIRKPVLCPRPETEELVDLVVKRIQKGLKVTCRYTNIVSVYPPLPPQHFHQAPPIVSLGNERWQPG
jgi:hypothetical protein